MVLVIAAYLAYQRHLRQKREQEQENLKAKDQVKGDDDDDHLDEHDSVTESASTANNGGSAQHQYFNSSSIPPPIHRRAAAAGPILEHHLHQAEQFRQTSSKFIQEAFVRCHPQYSDPSTAPTATPTRSFVSPPTSPLRNKRTETLLLTPSRTPGGQRRRKKSGIIMKSRHRRSHTRNRHVRSRSRSRSLASSRSQSRSRDSRQSPRVNASHSISSDGKVDSTLSQDNDTSSVDTPTSIRMFPTDEEEKKEESEHEKEESSFNNELIRQEWINAVFGSNFYPSNFSHETYLPPRQGTGLSKIPYYVTYPATIPSTTIVEKDDKKDNEEVSSEQQQKLGITLSRLALGLYVKRIEPTSEAYSAGVLEGSILVDINGMGMLAEPSRQALERLWQYEGHFLDRSKAALGSENDEVTSSSDADVASGSDSSSTSPATGSSSSLFPKRPLALRFYRHGKLYTCMFFSTPPFGISWAPCGNFALVQRAYGKAQAAGIRKGCLVAAVNSVSLRDMDHGVAAKCLKEHFESNQEITIRLAFTPAPARCSHYYHASQHQKQQKNEKDSSSKAAANDNDDAQSVSTTTYLQLGGSPPRKGKQQQQRKKPTMSKDGVEVRVHPLDESIGTMLSDTVAMIRGGQVPPPNKSKGSNSSGKNDGTSSNKQELTMPQGYDSSAVSEMAEQVAAGQMEAPTGIRSYRQRSTNKDPTTSTVASSSSTKLYRPVKTYEPCPELSKEGAFFQWDIMDALSYCIRFCQVGYDDDAFIQTTNTTAPRQKQHISKVFQQVWERKDAYKIVNAYLLQIVSVLCLPATIKDDEELQVATSHGTHVIVFLMELARRNQGFCHELYFVIRSFISAMEIQKSNQKENNTHNLLSILQSLDLLRSAQEQLVEHLTTTALPDSDQPSSPRPPLSPKTNPTDAYDVVLGTDPFSDGNVVLSKKKKPKNGVLKMFRKKSGSKNQPLDESRNDAPATPGKAVRSPRKSPIKLSAKPDQTATIMTNHHDNLAMPDLFDNMSRFLDELDGICDTIEKSLLKSISQKIADWALQPWSPSKETTLAGVTNGMRHGLRQTFGGSDKEGNHLPLANPIESTETLTSVDSKECYVLPSAHFPLLLTFNINGKKAKDTPQSILKSSTPPLSMGERDKVQVEEKLYRTRVEIVSLKGSAPLNKRRPSSTENNISSSSTFMDRSFSVQGAVSGTIKESNRSIADESSTKCHRWDRGNTLVFDTRSTWGAPRTLSLRLTATNIGEDGHDQVAYTDSSGRQCFSSEVGFCWVDLRPMWQQLESKTTKGTKNKQGSFATVTCRAKLLSSNEQESFDQHGELATETTTPGAASAEDLELELRVTTETLEFGEAASGFQSRKRMLLYKHDDDIRQEMFAIQFINTCDDLLKASGLDLKLLTFRCMPVEAKRGFIEWLPGSVPLSDICQPFGEYMDDTSNSDRSEREPATFADPEADELGCTSGDDDDAQTTSELTRAGLKKYESLRYKCSSDSGNIKKGPRGSLGNNPIQEFLRSTAYDEDAPYFIQKEAMDTYVKSCAGFCVLTYLLGVGDRHLDNLLLHQSGHFFHCDFSFILGNDPKKYLPMRITEDMIHGMGGKESDNYAKFLSLAGAAFVTLRRHENVRVLLSLIRLLAPSALPDVSINQNAEEVFLDTRGRLRLDLNDSQAISFIEELIESSVSSKMWLAVDAIHSLGKRF